MSEAMKTDHRLVPGEADILHHLQTFDIDANVIGDLQQVRALLVGRMEKILDDFYLRLSSIPAVDAIFQKDVDPNRARQMQLVHWMDWVFSGRFNAQYMLRCKRVGRVHLKHGVSPQYYLSGYLFLSRQIKTLILQEFQDSSTARRLCDSVDKALFLDIELAISVYCEAMSADWRRTSLLDELTDIRNRRGTKELISKTLALARRHGRPFCVGLMDIDHFKKVNDTFGHDAGDFILQAIAKQITDSVRETDIVGRWGGEEFIILMPETSLEAALQVCERVRRDIEGLETVFSDQKIRVTASFGVSGYVRSEETDEPVIQRADSALYAAKNKGRNRVEIRDG